MSAICGVVGQDGRPFAEPDLEGVLRALRPLGPRSQDAWAGTAGRVGVALGACGSAAVRSSDGEVCVVADAHLDCRADLLAALPLTAAASDTELILAAYERWGESCLDRLSGAFAFALSDARRGGVLVARDQTGVRPLQVHQRRGVFAFATTALALSALEDVGHELDRVRVGEWLALVPDSERTFVAGVTALAPAHSVWIEADGARRRRYWSLDTERFAEHASPAAYARELREALDDAVARRLPPAAPVGVQLSGGLDSASVAATAARRRPDALIHTYTAAPPPGWTGPVGRNQDADESELVRDLAERYGNLRPTFVSGDLGPLLALHDSRFAAGSPPPRNPGNELWMAASQQRAAADGVTALLTGNRGNAFFSADDQYWLAGLLWRRRFDDLARELGALARAGGPHTLARELAYQVLPPALIGARQAARARRAGIGADDGLRFAGPEAAAVVRAHARIFGPPPRRELRALALSGVQALGGFIAEAGAVRDALHGVRMSDPTGDVRLLAVCAAQPPWARRRDGRTRVVARDAMADRLPPSIAERTRRGAQLPDWLDVVTPRRTELAGELAAAREHAWCRELLDLDRIDAALSAWPDAASLRAHYTRTTRVYRDDLWRALLMCRYLRFFEAHAREARLSVA